VNDLPDKSEVKLIMDSESTKFSTSSLVDCVQVLIGIGSLGV